MDIQIRHMATTRPTFVSCLGVNLGDLGCLRGWLGPDEKQTGRPGKWEQLTGRTSASGTQLLTCNFGGSTYPPRGWQSPVSHFPAVAS